METRGQVGKRQCTAPSSVVLTFCDAKKAFKCFIVLSRICFTECETLPATAHMLQFISSVHVWQKADKHHMHGDASAQTCNN